MGQKFEGRRFDALDGLRGIAALAVAYMHITQTVAPIIPVEHRFPAAIAVDFFFMLSGFVLSYAYTDKLDAGLSARRFMLARVVRLYPLIPIGILLDALIVIGRGDAHLSELPLALLLFPTGLFHSVKAFLFDPPVWSLMFEFIASFCLATRMRRLRGWLLLIFLATFGTLDVVSWYFSADDAVGIRFLFAAIPRTAFAFAVGCAIYESHLWERCPRLNFWVLAGGLSVALLVPGETNPLYFSLAVLVLPFVLILAATATSSRVCHPLGELSYPLYILHFPVSRIIIYVAKRYTTNGGVLISLGMLASLVVAWIILKIYDEPFRRWLGRQFLLGRPKPVATASARVDRPAA